MLPIYCPDAKCPSKGTLSQTEIKHLICHAVLPMSNERDPNNNNQQTAHTNHKICYIDCESMQCTSDKDSLINHKKPVNEEESNAKSSPGMLFKRYLKLYENIGKAAYQNTSHLTFTLEKMLDLGYFLKQPTNP